MTPHMGPQPPKARKGIFILRIIISRNYDDPRRPAGGGATRDAAHSRLTPDAHRRASERYPALDHTILASCTHVICFHTFNKRTLLLFEN